MKIGTPQWIQFHFIYIDTRPPTAHTSRKSMIGQSAYMPTDHKTLGAVLIRRPPDKYQYNAEDCPCLLNSTAEECAHGKMCENCHTTVERLYHPVKYKTLACEVSC